MAKDSIRCSFCGKRQEQVNRIIAGPNVYICNECVDLCNSILHDEMHAGSAQQLELPADGRTVYLYRKRCADGIPVVRVETYLPYDSCAFVLEHDFNRESLYQVLALHDETNITNITRICEARAANTEDASVLDTKRGKPIQYFLSRGYNRQGKPIEYSVARYRGDQNSFEVRVSL